MITSGPSNATAGSAARRRGFVLTILVAIFLACPAEAALNLAYLVPGSGVKVHKQFRTASEPIKVCALTFDDGPDETYTMQVMRTLERLKVRATFFVVGDRVEEFPEQVKLLSQAGHEIGNHTYSHPDMAQLGETSQRRQISKTTEILSGLGIKTKWFRPPYGSASRTTIKLAEELGMDVVRWSVDPRDWAQPGKDVIAKRVARETCPGAVVLMHSTNAQTVAALPTVIADLRSRGYTLVTLSQWKAVVTGKIRSLDELKPFVPQFTEITSIEGLADPFYHPYGDRPVPVVFEELEHLSPQDSAHDIWNDATAGQAAPVVMKSPAAVTSLTVYSNFESDTDLNSVYSSGGSSRLYAFHSELPVKAALPVSAVVPVDAVAPPVQPAIQPAQPVVRELIPELVDIPAKPVELKPMPRLEFKLDAPGHPVPWTPPVLLKTTSLTRPMSSEGTAVLKLFLLVKTNSTDPGYWTALEAFAKEARADGLVFPTASFFGNPPSTLGCPWTFAGPRALKDIPAIDLDQQVNQGLLALATAGVSNLLVEAPATAAALQQRHVTDLILLRQLTAGLPVIPRPDSASGWHLPDGVSLCCFGDVNRTVLVLANNSSGSLELELLSQQSTLSCALWGGTDTICLEPLNGKPLHAGAESLLILYHDQAVADR